MYIEGCPTSSSYYCLPRVQNFWVLYFKHTWGHILVIMLLRTYTCRYSWAAPLIPLQALLATSGRTAAGHGLTCVRIEKEQRKEKGPPAAVLFSVQVRALPLTLSARGRRPPAQQRLAPFFHASALPTRRLVRRHTVYTRPALNWAPRP